MIESVDWIRFSFSTVWLILHLNLFFVLLLSYEVSFCGKAVSFRLCAEFKVFVISTTTSLPAQSDIAISEVVSMQAPVPPLENEQTITTHIKTTFGYT